MTFIELLIIAAGLSMDAFAGSICKGLSVHPLKASHTLRTAIWFGFFQGLMPVVGYYLGAGFSDLVSSVDHWIAFVLLGIIGGNMIRESFSKDAQCGLDPDFSARRMLSLSIATSIDALAVGISFAFLQVDIWKSALCIALVTAAFSAAGIRIGNLFGCRYKSKAEFTGGFILMAIGLKILLEHTLA